jgi:outer membrane protein assembly factor BamB
MPPSLARLRGWPLVAAIALLVALAAVLVVALRSSGGDGEESAKKPKPAAKLPALPKAWNADLARGSKPLPVDSLDSTPHGELRTWTVGDTLVLLGTRRVTAYDMDSGETRWTLRPPSGTKRICGASRAPNPAGLGGLVLASSRGCRVAALVDVRTGKLRWRRDLGRRWAHTANDADLYVGDRTVAVPMDYRFYRLLDVRTGRPVNATPAPTQPARAVVGEGLLVLSPLGGSRHQSIEVYDVDSRRLVSRTPVPRTANIEGIVSADPLVLDLRVNGQRAYRHIDGRGRLGRYVGKGIDNEPQLLGVLGDTVVASYESTNPLDRTARYYGFDVTTGEQRWTTSPDRTFVLGRRGDDLLTASLGGPGIAGVINEGPTGSDSALFVLGQAPAEDPSHQALLGTVTANGQWGVDFDTGWTDDLFLVQTDDTLTAYRLPQPGKRPLPLPEQRVDWADGDVRSEQAVDLCEAVRPSTLRPLGFRDVRLPPPAGCQWLETFYPDGAVHRLTVQTFALAPRKGASAVELAKRSLADLRHDETNRFRADTRYAGVGDEAWSDQNRRHGDDRSRLLVRYRNLIIIVDSGYGGLRRGPHPTGRALLRLQAKVVEDLLARLRG